MQLKVEGNANQIEVFKKKIADVLQKVEISTGNGPTFHITGIEEDASIEEVKKSVEDGTPVNVTSLRSTTFGSKTATITVTKS